MTGVVKTCYFTSLTANRRTGKGTIVLTVGTVDYDINAEYLTDEQLYMYLGHNVDLYYVEDDDEYKAKSIIIKQSDKELIIPSYEINTVLTSKTKIVYCSRDDRNEQTAEISKSAYVIYNRSFTSDYTAEDFKITDGNLRMLDTNRDGVYDVIFITDYKYTLVRAVSQVENYIYDKYLINHIHYDKDTIFIEDEISLKIGSIAVDDLLQSQTDKDGNVKVVQKITQRMIASAEQIEEDGITVGGEKYYFSGFYKAISGTDKKPAEYNEIKLGRKQCFLLNEYNEIITGININGGSTARTPEYGFLVAIGKSNGLSDKMESKILNVNGQMRIFRLKSNVKIDGVTVTDSKIESYFIEKLKSSYAGSVLNVSKIVKYTLDENDEICELDTEYYNYQKEDEGSVQLDVTGQYILSTDSGNFQGKAGVGSGTVIFSIPPEMSATETNYGVVSLNDLVHGRTYEMCAYDLKHNGEAGAILVVIDRENYEPKIENWAAVYMVDKQKTILNDELETKNAISVYSQYGYQQFVIEDGLDLSYLKRGDLVRFGFNLKSEIAMLQKVLYPREKVNKPYKSNDGYTNDYWFWYGKVLIMDGTVAKMDFSSDESDTGYFQTSDAYGRGHFIYDGKADKIEYIAADDIKSAEIYGDPDWMLMYAWKGKVKDIFVFRNITPMED